MKYLDVALFEIRLPPPWRPWAEVLDEAKRRHPEWDFWRAYSGDVPVALYEEGEGRPAGEVCYQIRSPTILPIVHEGGAVTYTLLGRKQ